MNRFPIILSFIFLLLNLTQIDVSAQTSNGQNIYTMNDLKVLAAEGSHRELLNHALDIRPTFRNTQWKELIEQSSINFIKNLLKKGSVSETDIKQVKQISIWPSLKNNEFYVKQRNNFFLKHIKQCLKLTTTSSTTTECNELINEYNSYKHPIEFPFNLVKILSNHPQYKGKLFIYAKPLLKHELSEFYCNKEPIKGLVLSHITGLSEKDFKQDLHPDCIKSLKKTLNEGILNNFDYAKSYFKALDSYNLITKATMRLYLLTSFLKDPGSKQIDNSIIGLKKLSKSPSQRKDLLDSLKKLDPLPDTIFNLNPKMTKARMRILNRNFPEFFNFYANTCLDYLSATKDFPNGNPTPNCHQFFKFTKNTHMISIKQRSQYLKATKFITR